MVLKLFTVVICPPVCCYLFHCKSFHLKVCCIPHLLESLQEEQGQALHQSFSTKHVIIIILKLFSLRSGLVFIDVSVVCVCVCGGGGGGGELGGVGGVQTEIPASLHTVIS